MFGRKDAQRRARFERLIAPHLEPLYATGVRMTRNPEEAADLLQDTCLKAYRFLDRFQEGTNFKAWIFKILTNVFINRYRKAQREQAVYNEVETDGHYARILAQGPARQAQRPEEDMLDHLLSDDIQDALQRLSPEFRMAVILSDVEEFSYKEIAEIMDCPVGTVMSRLYRGRRLLQRLLLQHAVDRGFTRASEAGAEAPEAKSEQVASVTDLGTFRQRKQDT